MLPHTGRLTTIILYRDAHIFLIRALQICDQGDKS